jgi:proteasome accessory factor C
MLPWLMERREVPLADVATTFRMTPAEVESELELAAMCGVPPFVDELIDVFVDDETVFVGVPRLFTKPLRLTAPEGFALVTAGRAAMQLPGADPASALGRGLAKLASALGEDIDDSALVVDLATTPMVEEFVAATNRVERLRIRYWTASRDETTERELTPRRVFHERGEWYVAGDDHRSGEYRTFRIDRVESVESTGTFDEAPADDSPADSSVAWAADGSLPRVTVRLRPAARWVVEEYPVDSATELGDGTIEARFAVVSERWLERLLLRAGTDAEVVEPGMWRDLGRRAAARVLKRYE